MSTYIMFHSWSHQNWFPCKNHVRFPCDHWDFTTYQTDSSSHEKVEGRYTPPLSKYHWLILVSIKHPLAWSFLCWFVEELQIFFWYASSAFLIANIRTDIISFGTLHLAVSRYHFIQTPTSNCIETAMINLFSIIASIFKKWGRGENCFSWRKREGCCGRRFRGWSQYFVSQPPHQTCHNFFCIHILQLYLLSTPSSSLIFFK